MVNFGSRACGYCTIWELCKHRFDPHGSYLQPAEVSLSGIVPTLTLTLPAQGGMITTCLPVYQRPFLSGPESLQCLTVQLYQLIARIQPAISLLAFSTQYFQVSEKVDIRESIELAFQSAGPKSSILSCFNPPFSSLDLPQSCLFLIVVELKSFSSVENVKNEEWRTIPE